MKLTPCDCGLQYLVRLDRALWMRLVPGRRHYFCVRCRCHQLLSRTGVGRLCEGLRPDLEAAVTAPGALEEDSTRPPSAFGPRGAPGRKGPGGPFASGTS